MPIEQRRQRVLPRRERHLPQVGAIEMQQIENIKNHAIMATCLEILLQKRKTRYSVSAFGYDFAVDERTLGRQIRDGACDGGEFFRPVQTFAGKQLYLAAVETGLNTIAIELDFMDPRFGFRRLVAERGKVR